MDVDARAWVGCLLVSLSFLSRLDQPQGRLEKSTILLQPQNGIFSASCKLCRQILKFTLPVTKYLTLSASFSLLTYLTATATA